MSSDPSGRMMYQTATFLSERTSLCTTHLKLLKQERILEVIGETGRICGPVLERRARRTKLQCDSPVS